ncbi:MAG: hypothetical protein IK125_06640 [Lachnospiraceae bacterium]|nr:hypothetical protein [Lachnospiraceae bacterium]
MAYTNEAAAYQGQSVEELEKDLNYYKVELEVVQLKKEEAITFSLKMVLLLVGALAVTILADVFMLKGDVMKIFGYAIIAFCIAVIAYAALMLIQRVPMIVSQQNVDTGVMMHPSALKREYEIIINEKEKLLEEARAREEQLRLEAEARRIESEAAIKAAVEEYGVGENLTTGDESGVSADDKIGLTISLEDALNEIRSFAEEED